MPSIAPRPKFDYQGHSYQTLLSRGNVLLTESLDEALFIIFSSNPLVPISIVPKYTNNTLHIATLIFNSLIKTPQLL